MAPETDSGLRRTESDGVVVLTLCRPQARNALSLDLLTRLASEFETLRSDAAARCVVLAAEGPAFCAGHDLRELTAARSGPESGRIFFDETMARCSGLMQTIASLPQPVIAAVEGVATAAGCQLVATCDLAVAGRAARFCTPGVDIGLFCSTPMVALTRSVSAKHAMEMLLLGDTVSAEDAFRMGLVNRLVEPGEALEAARAMALHIATKSPLAVRTGKALFRRQLGCDLAGAYELANKGMVENLLAADAVEGIGAFLEKRRPAWPPDERGLA